MLTYIMGRSALVKEFIVVLIQEANVRPQNDKSEA